MRPPLAPLGSPGVLVAPWAAPPTRRYADGQSVAPGEGTGRGAAVTWRPGRYGEQWA